MEDNILLVSEELQGEKESVATGKGRSVNSRKKRPLTDMTNKAASSIVTDQKYGRPTHLTSPRTLALDACMRVCIQLDLLNAASMDPLSSSFDIDSFVDEYHSSRFGFLDEEKWENADAAHTEELIEYWDEWQKMEEIDDHDEHDNGWLDGPGAYDVDEY